MFVWILNHISRSITWSLFILKASCLVINLNMVFHMVVSVYRLVKILKLAPIPWWISERLIWPPSPCIRLEPGKFRLMHFFDIGHQCYNQLTLVKTRYLLTSITWPYHRLKSTTHWDHVYFWSWPLIKCWFLIKSRAHVRLTCCKQSRIVRKLVKS